MRIKPMLMGALALGCACVFSDETKELGVNKDEVELPYAVVDGAVVLERQQGGLARRRSLRRPEMRKEGKYAVKLSSGALAIPDVIDGLPVRGIGNGAFSDCKGVTSVTIPASVTNIVDGAFSGCGEIASFSVDAANPTYSSRDGFLYSKDGTTLVAVVKGTGAISYEVVDGAVVLGRQQVVLERQQGGLLRRRSLQRPEMRKKYAVKLSSGALVVPDVIDGLPVRGIGNGAFSDCEVVTSVTIPASVTNIVDGAFSGCGEIASFSVDASNPSYGSRDGLLCSKDGTTLVAGINGEVTIPSCVTRIRNDAFNGRKGLKSVTIPENVTEIGQRAFANCEELTSVTMRGTRPDAENSIFQGCGKLKPIYVPASEKNWTWMKNWHGVPLVFVKDDGTFVEAGDPAKLIADGKLRELKTAGLEVEELDLASLKAQAENGDAAAMCELGSRYRRGIGLSMNGAESAKWTMKAASVGHERAIALCYALGHGVAKDEEEAVKWYRKAADRGDRCAMNNLGLCYQNGTGVEKNAKEAVKWMRMAADKGLGIAMKSLGNFYCYHGIGDDADDKEALKWMQMAAEKGDAEGMFGLGDFYRNGDVVDKDEKEAVKWYRKAAEKGHYMAMREVKKWEHAAAMKAEHEAKEHAAKAAECAAEQAKLEAERAKGEAEQTKPEADRAAKERMAKEAEHAAELAANEAERAKREAEYAKLVAELAVAENRKSEAERDAERAKHKVEWLQRQIALMKREAEGQAQSGQAQPAQGGLLDLRRGRLLNRPEPNADGRAPLGSLRERRAARDAERAKAELETERAKLEAERAKRDAERARREAERRAQEETAERARAAERAEQRRQLEALRAELRAQREHAERERAKREVERAAEQQ